MLIHDRPIRCAGPDNVGISLDRACEIAHAASPTHGAFRLMAAKV